MRKIAASVLAAVLSIGALSAPAAQETIDLVVLMDSSKSMFRYYEDVIDYVLSATAKDYLRFGDSFHILSFADDVQVELAQALKTEQDLRSAIARLYLLYPMGRNTDLVTALEGAYAYVDSLPSSGSKVIVLISDGVHSPAPGTKYAGLDVQAVAAKVEAAATRIKERGWTLKIVRVPFDGGAGGAAGGIVSVEGAGAQGGGESSPTSPGAGNYLDTVASAGGATVTLFDPSNGRASVDATSGLPSFALPAAVNANGRKLSLAAEVQNRSGAKLTLELEALLLEDGTDILSKKSSLTLEPGAKGSMPVRAALPASLAKERVSVLTLEPRFAGGARVSPARSTVRVERAAWAPGPAFWSPARIVAFAAMAALLVAAIVLLSRLNRRMRRRSEEPIVEAVIDSASARARAERASAPGRAAAPVQGSAPGAASARPSPAAADGAAAARRAAILGSRAAIDAGRAPAASSEAAAKPSPDARSRLGQAAIAPTPAAASGVPAAYASRAAGANASGASGAAGANAAGEPSVAAVQPAYAASRASKSSALAAASKTAHRDAAAQAALLSAAGATPSEDAKAAAVLDSWKAPSASKRALPLKQPAGRRAARASRPVQYASKVVRTASERIVLHVEGQNPNIGKRNIHVMHAGAKKTVGGGSSDFLVFLLPVPRNIAELHFDGDNLALAPIAPEYFPDCDGAVEACLGKPIRVLTDAGHELSLRFERYVPPVETLNRLLHSIDMPGLTGLDPADSPRSEEKPL